MNILDMMNGSLKEKVDSLINQNIITPALGNAILENRLAEFLMSPEASAEDRNKASFVLDNETRYRLMEHDLNPDNDPLKSLNFRDSQECVPYFFKNLKRFVERNDYEKILIETWVRGELDQFSPEMWKEAFQYTTSEKLLAAGDKIPTDYIHENKIEVYQGGGSEGHFEISWSLSKDVAKKFALMKWRRFDKSGNFIGFTVNKVPTIYKAVIDVKDVLWYTNDRNEMEVVLKIGSKPKNIEIVCQWERR